MKPIKQVGVLPPRFRMDRCKFGVNESAQQRDQAAERPSRQDQGGGVNLTGNYVWIDEDARSDNPSHDEHGGVERTEAAQQLALLHAPPL